MRALVWFALAVAGIGYWWASRQHPAALPSASDAKDTADAVDRYLREEAP